MFVIPAAGRIVRDPISRKALPPEGREVPESTHWIRRLAAGDVVLFAAPAPQLPAPPPEIAALVDAVQDEIVKMIDAPPPDIEPDLF